MFEVVRKICYLHKFRRTKKRISNDSLCKICKIFKLDFTYERRRRCIELPLVTKLKNKRTINLEISRTNKKVQNKKRWARCFCDLKWFSIMKRIHFFTVHILKIFAQNCENCVRCTSSNIYSLARWSDSAKFCLHVIAAHLPKSNKSFGDEERERERKRRKQKVANKKDMH